MRPSFIIVICATAGLLVGGALLFLFPKVFGLEKSPVAGIISSGKALVGGPFSLTDHKGKPVDEKSYKGKYKLIYFGYTYCPDVCPTELQVISAALDILGDKAKPIQPLFISVDPARDTVEVLAEYMTNFHDSFIGLTGTQAQVKAAAQAYRVYFGKVKTAKPTDAYLMDHSSIIYLMGPDGAFLKHFNFGVKPTDLAAEIQKHL